MTVKPIILKFTNLFISNRKNNNKLVQKYLGMRKFIQGYSKKRCVSSQVSNLVTEPRVSLLRPGVRSIHKHCQLVTESLPAQSSYLEHSHCRSKKNNSRRKLSVRCAPISLSNNLLHPARCNRNNTVNQTCKAPFSNK